MQWNCRLRGCLCAGFVYLCILSVPFAFSIKAGEMCPGSPMLFGFPWWSSVGLKGYNLTLAENVPLVLPVQLRVRGAELAGCPRAL